MCGDTKLKKNKYKIFAYFEVITAMENKTSKSVRSVGMEFKDGSYRDSLTEEVKWM